jgi:hypothetical protein
MKLTNAQGRELLNNLKKPGKPVARWGKSGQTESQQQAECVEWFRETYPEYSLLLYAVPNGGKRSGREAAQFAREGVVSGVPDQVLAVPKNGYHGLYIEQKKKGNKPSPNQLTVMGALTGQGYKCVVVYSTEEFQQVITEYLAPTF